MSEQSDPGYPHLADIIRSHLDSDPEYSMSQWIEEEGIPDTEFLAMARDAELGSAWAEAEAALPEGWEVVEVSKYDREEGQLLAWWGAVAAIAREDDPSLVVRRDKEVTAETPAAALRALAVRLKVTK